MFSGKSTELLRRLKRYEIGGHRILRVKFAEDTRYSNDSISTHDRQTTKAVGAKLLSEIGDLWTTFDVIGIDEGQFFDDVRLVSTQLPYRWLRSQNKRQT